MLVQRAALEKAVFQNTKKRTHTYTKTQQYKSTTTQILNYKQIQHTRRQMHNNTIPTTKKQKHKITTQKHNITT